MKLEKSLSRMKTKTLKRFSTIALLLLFIALASVLVFAPPSPHNIAGRVVSNGSNGVANGMPVLLNDTVSGDIVLASVFAPPIPPLMGSYSATISGNDNDLYYVYYIQNGLACLMNLAYICTKL